jgi:hypothetical protein
VDSPAGRQGVIFGAAIEVMSGHQNVLQKTNIAMVAPALRRSDLPPNGLRDVTAVLDPRLERLFSD